MAQSTYMVKLGEIVKKLPNGWKTQVTGGDANKSVMFTRMMKKDDVSRMTESEFDLLNKLLDVIKEFKKSNEQIEKEIKKIIEQ